MVDEDKWYQYIFLWILSLPFNCYVVCITTWSNHAINIIILIKYLCIVFIKKMKGVAVSIYIVHCQGWFNCDALLMTYSLPPPSGGWVLSIPFLLPIGSIIGGTPVWKIQYLAIVWLIVSIRPRWWWCGGRSWGDTIFSPYIWADGCFIH